MHIEPYQSDHLTQLSHLINAHFSAVIPGWSLPGEYIETHLARNPGQYVIDPWVIERKTLCVLDRQRVVAAAHLLRYGTGENVGEHFQNSGDIAWLLVWPQSKAAADALLQACHDQMCAWDVREIKVWDSTLPCPMCAGIPHVWPHLITQGGWIRFRCRALRPPKGLRCGV